MIKILDCNNKNYVSKLSKLLIKRKSDDKISKNIVVKIIRDVKKNGDKAVVKYEKKYSKNSEIIVNKKNYFNIFKLCMIITRTPLRISFFGGGTDLPSYYKNVIA